MTGSIEVLLVKDNASDVRLIREGMTVLQPGCRLSVAGDGEEALDFVYRRGKHELAPRPALILLDLNLPRKDGFEVLEEIKKNPFLKRIPVVVLTSSSSMRDVNRTYDLGANSYLKKAASLDEIYDLVRNIENHWLRLSVLPGI